MENPILFKTLKKIPAVEQVKRGEAFMSIKLTLDPIKIFRLI